MAAWPGAFGQSLLVEKQAAHRWHFCVCVCRPHSSQQAEGLAERGHGFFFCCCATLGKVIYRTKSLFMLTVPDG